MEALHRAVAKAKRGLAAANVVWQVVRGPIVATVATMARIGWEALSATQIRTHTGRVLELTVDPPAVVKGLADEAVRRWRWARAGGRCSERSGRRFRWF